MTPMLDAKDILLLHRVWECACKEDSFASYTAALRGMGIIDPAREMELDRQWIHWDSCKASIFRNLRLAPGQLPFRPAAERSLTPPRP